MDKETLGILIKRWRIRFDPHFCRDRNHKEEVKLIGELHCIVEQLCDTCDLSGQELLDKLEEFTKQKKGGYKVTFSQFENYVSGGHDPFEDWPEPDELPQKTSPDRIMKLIQQYADRKRG